MPKSNHGGSESSVILCNGHFNRRGDVVTNSDQVFSTVVDCDNTHQVNQKRGHEKQRDSSSEEEGGGGVRGMTTSYQSLSTRDEDEQGGGTETHSQSLSDGEFRIFAFHPTRIRLVLFNLLNLILLGFPFLISRWVPTWKLKFTCHPSSLSRAKFVLLIIEKEDLREEFVCPVFTDTSQFLPEEFSVSAEASHHIPPPLVQHDSKTHLLNVPEGIILRYFCYRNEKFIWDDFRGEFKKICGMDNVTCQQVAETFHGLTHAKRMQLRAVYGGNIIDVEVKSYFKLLIDEVLNPFYVFQILSVVLWCFDEYIYYASCVVIISAISIIIALVETKRQSEMLRDMARSSDVPNVTVKRNDGQEEEISSRDLVPGDIILIPPCGFVMPCDAALITGSCIVNESMLTGESIPVQKSSVIPSQEIFNSESHRRHTLFCGTQIIQTRFYPGHKAACVVVRTGFNTVKGELINSILYPKEIGFKFYSDAMKFILLLFSLATVGMLYSIYLYVSRGAAWYTTVIRVLDIVTIVVPPALPAAMTVGTVYAQSRLKKKLIYCISPPRINFCGKLKLICFDKTGTLTEEGLDLWCVVPVSECQFKDAVWEPHTLEGESSLLRAMASCHSLTFINKQMSGDPLDIKMFLSTGWELEEPVPQSLEDTSKFDMLSPSVVKNDKLGLEMGILREFEFTPQLQRMSVVVKSLDSSFMTLYSKGAPEKIRGLCNPSGIPADFDKILDSFTVKGYRVLAIGSKKLQQVRWHQIQRIKRDVVEKDLEFCGFLVMQNNLKGATIPVIEELNSANIRCVMVTGDNMLTALSVARECGIVPACDKVVIANVTEDNKLEFSYAAQHTEFVLNDEELSSSPGNNNGRRRQNSLVPTDYEATELLPSFVHSPTELDSHSLVPISAHSAPHAIIQLQDSNYHIVMTGRTWSLLEDVASSEDLERIVAKGAVYARMSPENKSQLVELLQKLGYVVGMCGDGANDCSALKMAHVGISLSEAEASVAAPFTSKIPDISCVPALIREGRCALVTSFGIFKYMALYSLIQFSSVLLLYTHATNLADTQFLYIDLGITTTIAVVMGRTEPYSHLVTERPMGSLVSFTNVFSLLIQVLISASVQAAAMSYLQVQPWFRPVHLSSPNELVTLCWETTTVFSVSSFQYLILAFVFSKGPPFRKPFYTNGLFVLCYVILSGCTILLVTYPVEGLASFFYLVPIDDETGSFRLMLLVFPCVHFLLSLFFEHNWANVVIKRLGRLVIKKKEKSPYKLILKEIEKDLSWPPIVNIAPSSQS